MIPVKEVAAFAFATFGESINPGPTLAALVQARTRSWQEAWGVVIGVALANIVWVIIVVLLRSFASELPSWPEAEPLLKAFAALILVFIATRAAAWPRSQELRLFLRNWTTPLAAAPAIGARSFAADVRRGFVVHFLNPLSLTYYFGAYSGTLAKIHLSRSCFPLSQCW